jgi:hypothetical protein
MEWDGKVQSATFTCAVSGRTLAPGEVFWSALVLVDGGVFSRRDVADEVWDTQDRSPFISWWKQRVPLPDPHRQRLKLDEHLLRTLFHDLRESRVRAQQCLCFVVALCLVRARAFRMSAQTGDNETVELVVEDKSDKRRWLLRDPGMTTEDQERVQQALLTIIGGSVALTDTPTGPPASAST